MKNGEIIYVAEEKEIVYGDILQWKSQAPQTNSPLAIVKRIGFMKTFIVGIILLLSGLLARSCFNMRRHT